MADENNNAPAPSGEDSNGNQPQGQPPTNDEGVSSKAPVDPAEQARRDQQSKKDKSNAENDNLREDVDYLRAREAERAKEEYVKNLLVSDSDKYPDVKASDPMFKYAASEDEVKEIAAELQNRFKTMQQDALASVQVEADQGLTDQEIAEKEKELEEQTNKEGRSTFGGFISTNLRRKK